MTTFKIQKIRSCQQCGVVLGLKCKACINHPERKPKIIVLHDWPPVLETCPSGHCIRIACQRPGCSKTMWRLLRNGRGGKSIFKESFCSRACNIIIRAKEKNQGIKVKCGWHLCHVMVPRKPSETKQFKTAYCRQEHYYLAMRKSIHDMKQSKINELEFPPTGLLYCEKCRDVQEHKTPANFQAECIACGTKRSQGLSAMTGNESLSLKVVAK